jgi:hypothetical protein
MSDTDAADIKRKVSSVRKERVKETELTDKSICASTANWKLQDTVQRKSSSLKILQV